MRLSSQTWSAALIPGFALLILLPALTDRFILNDFYNRIIGHYEVDLKHPGRDRFRGRIWRVSCGDPESVSELKSRNYGQDLTQLDVRQLLDVIRDSPTAQKESRSGCDCRPARMQIPLRFFKHRDAADSGVTVRRYVLCLLAQRNALTADELAAATRDPDELVRVHAFRVLREFPADAINRT